MALEIKRTPVLEGQSAVLFLLRMEKNKTIVPSQRVNDAMKIADKILSNRKKR